MTRVGAVALVFLAGCSSSVKYVDADASAVPYVIEFNSQSTAIWLDNVVVTVVTLDPAKYPTDELRAAVCTDLLNRRRTGQSFTPDYDVVGQTPEVTPCELADSAQKAGQFETPLGPAAIVAVGKNTAAGGDVQIGCGWGTVTTSSAIRVNLEPFSNFVPIPPQPPSNCTRLADKCSNGGKCP